MILYIRDCGIYITNKGKDFSVVVLFVSNTCTTLEIKKSFWEQTKKHIHS